MGTFEVTLQYFAYFISISSLVFENDKWTFWGCFGHFNMSHLLNCAISRLNRHLLKRINQPTCRVCAMCFHDLLGSTERTSHAS